MQEATFFEVLTKTLQQSYQTIGSGLVEIVPSLLAAVIIFVIGWVFASLVEKLIRQVVSAAKVDAALNAAQVGAAFARAGFTLDSGRFLGALVKWFIVIVFLVASLNILGLSEVTSFLSSIAVGFLPKAIAAVLIILVAAVIAETTQRAVIGVAKAAAVSTANLLGSIAKWAIWVFAIIAALYQLGIAPQILQTLFTGIVVALSLSIGLSFGLGGQEAAARFIEKLRGEIKKD